MICKCTSKHDRHGHIIFNPRLCWLLQFRVHNIYGRMKFGWLTILIRFYQLGQCPSQDPLSLYELWIRIGKEGSKIRQCS